MQQQTSDQVLADDNEEQVFTFRQMAKDWAQSIAGALRYWRLIALVGIMGGLLGLAYAIIKKNTYTARLSFIVEESKSSSGSLASALVGQFGLDVGSLAGGNGILSGDNVLELLKSQSFLKKTLLTPYGDSNATVSLADQYAAVYGWKEKWKDDKDIGGQMNFPSGKVQFSRIEDSLLHVIIKRISEKELSIGKPDKKLGIFELTVTTRDEKLSALFCERLLNIAAGFYVETKTRRLLNNVLRLQRRADSIGTLLYRKTMNSAESEKLLLDANPAYTEPVVSAEISSRNKVIQSTIYAEIIKNLELSRTSLVQETPTVQIVDRPELPLIKNEVKAWKAILLGLLAGVVAGVLAFAVFGKKPAVKNHNL